MIDAAFLMAIDVLSRKAAAVEVKEVPALEGVLIHNHSSGEYTLYDRKPARRGHHCGDVASLCGAFVQFGAGLDKASLWYRLQGVVAVLDDADRRDLLHCGLRVSSAMAAINSIRGGRQFDHRQLMQFLRVNLRDVVEQAVIDQLADLKIDKQAESTVQPARRSVRSDASAAVGGGKPLPESIEAIVQVFDPAHGIGEDPQRIEIVIAADLDCGVFTLLPVPADLSVAEQRAVEALAVRLQHLVRTRVGDEAAEPRLFHGMPLDRGESVDA